MSNNYIAILLTGRDLERAFLDCARHECPTSYRWTMVQYRSVIDGTWLDYRVAVNESSALDIIQDELRGEGRTRHLTESERTHYECDALVGGLRAVATANLDLGMTFKECVTDALDYYGVDWYNVEDYISDSHIDRRSVVFCYEQGDVSDGICPHFRVVSTPDWM